MVVLRGIGVRGHNSVMPRVHMVVEVAVGVHVAVHEILPCVKDEHGDYKLGGAVDECQFTDLFGVAAIAIYLFKAYISKDYISIVELLCVAIINMKKHN